MWLFKKKNKKENTFCEASKEVKAEKQEPASSSREMKFISFKSAYANYESIEKVAEIIEKAGYPLNSVSTHGTDSSHDGDVGFNHSYSSISEFKDKVGANYIQAKKNYKDCAKLNWGCTIFTFYKSFRGEGVKISITSVGPGAEEVRMSIRYMTEDKAKVQSILSELDEYLEKTSE